MTIAPEKIRFHVVPAGQHGIDLDAVNEVAAAQEAQKVLEQHVKQGIFRVFRRDETTPSVVNLTRGTIVFPEEKRERYLIGLLHNGKPLI